MVIQNVTAGLLCTLCVFGFFSVFNINYDDLDSGGR